MAVLKPTPLSEGMEGLTFKEVALRQIKRDIKEAKDSEDFVITKEMIKNINQCHVNTLKTPCVNG